jgi:hypothetical protein
MLLDAKKKKSLSKCSICNLRHNLVFSKSFISNSFFKQFIAFGSSSRVPIIFISSTYTIVIANSFPYLFMKSFANIPLFANIHGGYYTTCT